MINLPNMDEAMEHKLRRLLESYPGYDINQNNGQRQFGHPTPTPTPPPGKGCEVFVGKLPRDLYEDELVPVFAAAGTLYKLRLMMDFSGSTRGYAFVQYTSREAAEVAVERLHQREVRRGHRMAVTKSLDNCRLYVGGLSVGMTRAEIEEALAEKLRGVTKVFMYGDPTEPGRHRGFAFVEFASHREAALARRSFYPSPLGEHVSVDWAEPEVEVDDATMNQVRVLFVRNVLAHVTENALRRAFGRIAPPDAIEKVKKCKDFAFVHFFTRQAAQLCMDHWNGRVLEGGELSVTWAKPVSREQHSTHKVLTRLQRCHIGPVATKDGDVSRGNNGPCFGRLVLRGQAFVAPPSVLAHRIMPHGATARDLGVDAAAVVRLADKCARFEFAPPFYQFVVKATADRDDPDINACKVTLSGRCGESRSFRANGYHRTALHAQVASAQLVLDNWNRLDAASRATEFAPIDADVAVSAPFQPQPSAYQQQAFGQQQQQFVPVFETFGAPAFGFLKPADSSCAMPQAAMLGFTVPPPGYYETMYYDQRCQPQTC